MSKNEKPTMREFLAWEHIFELPYGRFKELVADSQSAKCHLPPLRRKETVPRGGIAVLWGGTKVVEREVAQPERASVVLSRDYKGRNMVEVKLYHSTNTMWSVSFSLHEHEPLTRKLVAVAGVPEVHSLPDEVVENPPFPEWVHLGQGCSCGSGDFGVSAPRFRWEIVEELRRLLHTMS